MKRWISTLLAIVMVFAMGGVVFSEEPVNIAQGKAVTYMDGVMTDAGVVTDGNLDTSVVVFTDGSQIPFWWIKIDLGKEYAVSAVELATRIQWFGDDNEIGEIRFFGSNENIDVANMEEIAMSPHSGSMVVGAGESWHYDLPKERTCRYIAVGGAVGAGEVRVVSEVRVFGTDTEPLPQNWENVAAGKIVTCMDGLNLNGGSLTSLTDGTVATNVVLGGAVETPFWFKIDLGKPYSIAALELSTRHKWYGNDTEISLISFLGSNEDIAVDQMETITETPSDSEMDIGAGESWHYDLPEQKTYRYIAVSGVSPAGWNKIISEIRVFGSESSVTPPEPDPEPEENIAQGITPVVSGENLNTMGMLPETLTDGDLGTIWGVTNSDPASPAVYSVVVDLGKPYDIETVELVARDAGWGGEGEFSLISVKGSLENVPAAQMEEITTTPHHEAENKVTQGGTWSYPLPQAKTYRYIAVAGECPIGWAKVVAELRVFGSEATIIPPEPAENLALNQSMTWTDGLNFLGDIATYGPDKMVDGQDATFTAIQTDGQDTPFTLCIDLGGVYMVEEIELQARTPNYEIHELSNVSVHLGTSDPENLPVVATTPSYNAEDAIQEGGTWSYRLPKAKRGQYVAISGVIPAGYMFGCAEFRVFGTEAPVIEAEDRNVLLHKPYTSTEGIPFNGANEAFALNDGSEDTAMVVTPSVDTTYFVKFDLLNFYDVKALELVARDGKDWGAWDLGGVELYGSIADVPIEQMEKITATPQAYEGGVPSGQTWRYELPEMQKYRYIALKAMTPGGYAFYCKEFRVFAETDVDVGEWKVTAQDGQEITSIVPGETYTAAVTLMNYSRMESDSYILIAAAYDAQGYMTAIRCRRLGAPEAGSEETLSATLALPAGTVRMSAVLVDEIEQALMVVDSVDLYTE